MSEAERDASRRMLEEFRRLREIVDGYADAGRPIPMEAEIALSDLERLLNVAMDAEIAMQ